jgi:hypothetical protein
MSINLLAAYPNVSQNNDHGRELALSVFALPTAAASSTASYPASTSTLRLELLKPGLSDLGRINQSYVSRIWKSQGTCARSSSSILVVAVVHEMNGLQVPKWCARWSARQPYHVDRCLNVPIRK